MCVVMSVCRSSELPRGIRNRRIIRNRSVAILRSSLSVVSAQTAMASLRIVRQADFENLSSLPKERVMGNEFVPPRFVETQGDAELGGCGE